MAYKHGVYVSEVPTSILPPVRVAAGMPVVIGTAPVNLTAAPAANVNKPVLCYNYQEAVAAFGFMPANSNGNFDYTISEFMDSHFSKFAVAPVVFINVLNPADHKAAVASESRALVDNSVKLVNTGVLRSSVVVKSGDGNTTYVLGTDYTVTYNARGETFINRVVGGAIATSSAALTVSYDRLNPSLVDEVDIIGGVGVGGELTGLELVNQVFPRFRQVPGQIVVPKYSQASGVAAVMAAKASNINGHFKAIALTDIPTDDVAVYSEAPEWKNDNNIVDSLQVSCWPMLSLGGTKYHLSTQLAGLICQVDGANDDTPYVSPSNKNLQMDSAVLIDGTEVYLGPEQANYLNGEGIVTALNFVGGWKAWGNRTAAYPGNTDPKDAFLPIRRMFNWVGNTTILTYWQRLDFPLNRRQIQTITDSVNIWLNGLVSAGYLLGGRVEFQEDENPATNLMDGKARFHLYLTPPSPNEEIDFVLEYDPAYLNSLFE